MNLTQKLKLELLIREQLEQHGEEFYIELARILSKIEHEQTESVDGRGKPNFVVRW